LEVLGVALGAAGLAAAIAVPSAIEALRRPRLEIRPSPWSPSGPVDWTFAAIQVHNKPLSAPFSRLLTREVAQGCVVDIDFFAWGTDERAMPTVPGRWSSHPEPIRSIPERPTIASVLAETTVFTAFYDATMDPREHDVPVGHVGEEVAVAVLTRGEGGFAWGKPRTRIQDGRIPIGNSATAPTASLSGSADQVSSAKRRSSSKISTMTSQSSSSRRSKKELIVGDSIDRRVCGGLSPSGLIPVLLIALALAGCGTKTLTKTVRLTETRTTRVVKRVTPPPLVLVPDQGGDLVYKPDEIGIGASSVINHIRWIGYGGALAVGRGKFPKNTCTPNCAEGTVTWVPVTVRLKERILCRGRLAYTLMAVDGAGFNGRYDALSAVIGAYREAC
jgi:hypothetical protein